MPIQSRRIVALILASGLIVVGCGDQDGAESKTGSVRTVAAEFSAAFGSGNIKKACSLWDPAAWKGLPRAYGCEGTFGGDTTPFQNSFLTAKIERVVVNGDTATVGFSNKEIVRFKRVKGQWTVEDLGGSQNSIG